MKGVRQVVTGGLRVKARRSGDYSSLLIQGEGGRVIFRGAIIFAMWPKIKAALDRLIGADHGSETNFEEAPDA